MSLHQVSLLGAGLAVAVAADVVQGEEEVVLLVELSRQLDLKLMRRKSRVSRTQADADLCPCDFVRLSYFVVEFRALLVMQHCGKGIFGKQGSSGSAIDTLRRESTHEDMKPIICFDSEGINRFFSLPSWKQHLPRPSL